MRELTERELHRQDYVDNQIYNLLVTLAPERTMIPWDIEMIGDVRDEIKRWVVHKLGLCEEERFYPYVCE